MMIGLKFYDFVPVLIQFIINIGNYEIVLYKYRLGKCKR